MALEVAEIRVDVQVAVCTKIRETVQSVCTKIRESVQLGLYIDI